MSKSYQFKTHCKTDSHISETANIILLVTIQKWTPLRVQTKYSIEIRWDVIVSTNITAVEFEYDFPLTRRAVTTNTVKKYQSFTMPRLQQFEQRQNTIFRGCFNVVGLQFYH